MIWPDFYLSITPHYQERAINLYRGRTPSRPSEAVHRVILASAYPSSTRKQLATLYECPTAFLDQFSHIGDHHSVPHAVKFTYWYRKLVQ